MTGQTVLLIALFFMLSLGLGSVAFTPLLPLRSTGPGLLKLMYTTALSALLLGIVISLCLPSSFFQGFFVVFLIASGLLFFLSLRIQKQEEWCLLQKVSYILQIIFLVSAIFLLAKNSWYSFFYLVTSAFFVGINTFAMILGHWYLVTPKLSNRPLLFSMGFFWALLAFRVTYSVVAAVYSQEMISFDSSIGFSSFNWMLFIMRVAWGELVLGILSYYAWRLIKMNSIQSATGVLYVMVFFVFVGELMATYFYFSHGKFL